MDQASITLGDFKRCIDRKQNFKYFFQSFDEDYGLVKEEITADSMALPQTQEGKIVCFLTPGEEPKVCFHFFASKNHNFQTKPAPPERVDSIRSNKGESRSI